MGEDYIILARARIGHVHLKVSSIEHSFEFYHDLLGFEIIIMYGKQAAFISAGGYHHHIGLNTWHSGPDSFGIEGIHQTRWPGGFHRLARCMVGDEQMDAQLRLSGRSELVGICDGGSSGPVHCRYNRRFPVHQNSPGKSCQQPSARMRVPAHRVENSHKNTALCRVYVNKY